MICKTNVMNLHLNHQKIKDRVYLITNTQIRAVDINVLKVFQWLANDKDSILCLRYQCLPNKFIGTGHYRNILRMKMKVTK